MLCLLRSFFSAKLINSFKTITYLVPIYLKHDGPIYHFFNSHFFPLLIL